MPRLLTILAVFAIRWERQSEDWNPRHRRFTRGDGHFLRSRARRVDERSSSEAIASAVFTCAGVNNETVKGGRATRISSNGSAVIGI